MTRKIPGVIVIDHEAGRLTIDGDELLPAHYIANDLTVEVMAGSMARVDLGIYCDNVLIRTRAGTTSPTAEAEAKRIVRKGLADIIDWLEESK